MKLTKFQQYIKDEEIEADKDEVPASLFIEYIKEPFSDEYELLMDDIQNSLDIRTHIERKLSFNGYANAVEIGDQIKLRVNELIVTTLEEIEDIETVNEMEPEDPMDTIKRHWELER